MAEERSGAQHEITHSRSFDHKADYQTTNASDWVADFEAQAESCPRCNGQGVPLGQVGRMAHHRCRDCGSTFSTQGE